MKTFQRKEDSCLKNCWKKQKRWEKVAKTWTCYNRDWICRGEKKTVNRLVRSDNKTFETSW